MYTTFYDTNMGFWNRNYWMLSVPKKKVFSKLLGFSKISEKNAFLNIILPMQLWVQTTNYIY